MTQTTFYSNQKESIATDFFPA